MNKGWLYDLLKPSAEQEKRNKEIAEMLERMKKEYGSDC